MMENRITIASLILGGMLTLYALAKILVRGIIKIAAVFQDATTAHHRITRHKKIFEKRIENIELKIAHIEAMVEGIHQRILGTHARPL